MVILLLEPRIAYKNAGETQQAAAAEEEESNC